MKTIKSPSLYRRRRCSRKSSHLALCNIYVDNNMSELIQNELYDYSNETIDKSLLGIATIHNGLIVSEDCRTIFRKDCRNMKGKDDQVIISEKSHENYSTLDVNLQGLTMSPISSHKFLFIISMACKAIIACTKQLDTIDEKFGNGDYGTSLARGAKAIETAIQEDKILGRNPFATFLQISRIIERTVGGLHGELYALFLRKIAEAFLTYQSDEQITAKTWLSALIAANRAIKQLEMPALSDHTLSHVLVDIEIDLKNALNRNMNPVDAFGVAVRTAENFNTNYKFKHPDPEAHAVGIWMRATYEGIKLKFTHLLSEPLSI